MYKHITIDSDTNMLLCSTKLVGNGELVEIFAPDQESPRQACGRILRKIDDKTFEVHQSFDGHDALGRRYELGEKCVLRVLLRNLSGTKRRKFASDEKVIVSMEKDEHFREKKVTRAKTGSVRKRRK